jgi:uncharacterized membrane protein YfcA
LTLLSERRSLAVDKHSVRLIGLASIPASFIGVLILGVLDKVILQAAVGVFVLASVAAQQYVGTQQRAPRTGLLAAGSVSGFLNSTLGISGPPLVVAFISRGHRGDKLRDTLAACILVVSCTGAPFAYFTLSENALRLTVVASFVLLPAILVGQRVGRTAFMRLTSARHLMLMRGVIVASGLVSLTSALVSSIR